MHDARFGVGGVGRVFPFGVGQCPSVRDALDFHSSKTDMLLSVGGILASCLDGLCLK